MYLINFKFKLNIFFWLLPKLILLFSLSFDYILKIIKSLYNIPKVRNYWFVTYHIYHKIKLKIIELLYNFCFFYSFSSFNIMKM